MERLSGWSTAMVRNDDNSLDCDGESIHTHVATSPTQALSSPAPVNNGQPTLSVTSYSKARPRGIDNDKLFDLPEEPLIQAPAPRGRKRKLANSSKNRQSLKPLRILTSPSTLEAGSSQPYTLPASEKFPGSLLKSKRSEPFLNASLMKSTGTVSARREASFNPANIVIAASSIEKLSTFRFHTHQPSLSHLSDVGTDPCTSHPTPPAANDVVGGYDSSSYQNDIVLVGNKDSSTTSPIKVTDLQLHSNDEFPMDFEDEVEMAQLPLFDRVINANTPKNSEGSLSISSQLQSEDFDNYYELSIHNSRTLGADPAAIVSNSAESMSISDNNPMVVDINDCSSVRYGSYQTSTSLPDCRPYVAASPRASTTELSSKLPEYLPLPIFARPNFPSRVLDRSPIDGVSANPFSRICFRIGELIREGGYWDSLGQDTVIELFARVCSSSREAGTSKQIFQFADIFHDRPPFPNGVLENCKAYGLQETESRQLLGPRGKGQMVRCIGRWKRVLVEAPGWMFHIINIRATDWEEVRWTKEIAGARMAFRDP